MVRALQHAGVREDHEFPALVHLSRAIPGFGASGVEHLAEARQGFASVVRWGLQFSPAAIAVPCNSLEAVVASHDELAALLTPVSSVPPHLKGTLGRVSVLASASSRRDRLYDRALHTDCHYGDTADQRELDALIHLVMGRHCPNEAQERLLRLVERQRHRGAQAIVLGCTELSCIPSLTQPDVLDAMDWLVDRSLETLLEHL